MLLIITAIDAFKEVKEGISGRVKGVQKLFL